MGVSTHHCLWRQCAGLEGLSRVENPWCWGLVLLLEGLRLELVDWWLVGLVRGLELLGGGLELLGGGLELLVGGLVGLVLGA